LRKKIFDAQSISFGLKALMVLMLLSLLFLTLFAFNAYDVSYIFGPDSMLWIFVIIGILVFVSKPCIFTFVWSLFFVGIPFEALYGSMAKVYSLDFFAGLIGLIVGMICIYHLPKRNNPSFFP